MNYEQKAYIEEHIDLIRTNEWDKFFDSAPRGIGGVLYEVGLNFLDYMSHVPTYAFYKCSSITSITIPPNVTSIDGEAFYACYNLIRVMIPSGVTRIGYEAFYNCSSLTSITIPAGVTSIGAYAFEGCSSLTSIIIPSSVEYVGQKAFDGCSNLKELTYSGTKEEFTAMYKEGSWRDKSVINTVRCSDGILNLNPLN